MKKVSLTKSLVVLAAIGTGSYICVTFGTILGAFLTGATVLAVAYPR